ncbi:MAG: M28 family peptidase [Acidobacteriota bacterium]
MPSASVSAVRLEKHVRFLTEDVVPRDAEHPAQLEVVAQYLEHELSLTGARVERQSFNVRGEAYANVIASVGPRDGPRVIVGAHYDAFGLLGVNPGADDNASGTAGLVELARLLVRRPPPLRVDLVAFANEEPPYFASPGMGSAVHAKRLRRERAEVWGMVSLEMIGYFTEEQPWPNMLYRALFPGRGDFIAVVGRTEESQHIQALKQGMRAGPIPVYSFRGPMDMPGLDSSDHRSYWHEGYPAVMVTDTGFIRNPNYHTPRDTAETLDYVRMAGVVEGLAQALWALES